jgi:hypothetical protein
LKLWRLLKIEDSMERWSASPFGSAMGEKGRTLGKTYGIKVRCYWEHLWGTHWELEGNILGRKEKEKKSRHFECILSLTIGCMKFLFPKLFVTIFGLG